VVLAGAEVLVEGALDQAGSYKPSQILKINSGFKMKVNREGKPNKWNVTKEFIVKEYVQNKKSLPMIAKELGIPYETLFYYKKRFGISSHSQNLWNKGVRLSPDTEFKKGITPWNKGTHGIVNAWNKGKKLSEDHKKKVSIATKKAMANPGVKLKVQRTQFKKGIVPWNKDRKGVYSEETIGRIREARLKQIFPKKDTYIETILFKILKELNVNFEKHKAIKTICQADAFVKPNIVLFADGDFWHCNPEFYKEAKTKVQTKNLERDRKADSKLIKDGYIVGRYWEHDLVNKRDYCKDVIVKLIKKVE